MIPVPKVQEPGAFDARVRTRGNKWLKLNPNSRKRPPAYWSEFIPDLENGFNKLCGYAAMFDPTGGTVDHYLSVSVKDQRYLAYEWSNYRFASAILNSSKKNADNLVLDPYEVGEGWFEILLPSLIMRTTSAVPTKLRKKANYTLDRLQLRNGARVIRWRQSWYEPYKSGDMSLNLLRQFAPLIAAAVDKELAKNGFVP